MLKCLRLLLLLGAVQCMVGCQSWWPWGDDDTAAQSTEESAALERRAAIQNNLDRGLLALQTDRLTMPKEDCAVFYYRKVLAIDPDNQEAQAGIDKVAVRYLQLAKRAHANGNDKQAASWLKRAEEVHGPTGKTSALKAKLKNSPKGQDDRAIEFLPATDYLLSREALDERGPEIMKRLADIAQRAESRQRAALVVARDQAEGDWIVKVMREAVPHYTLQTRVELASRPAVILLSGKKWSESKKLDSKKLQDHESLKQDKQFQEGKKRLESQKQLLESQKKTGNQDITDSQRLDEVKKELKKARTSPGDNQGAIQE